MNNLDIDRRYDALRASQPPEGAPLAKFGRNADGYDLGGPDGTGEDDTDKEWDECDYGDGAPGEALVEKALLVFAKLWQRYDTATAAAAFHIEPGLIDHLKPFPPAYEGLSPRDTDFQNCVQLISSSRCYTVKHEKGERQVYVQTTIAEVAALLNVTEQKVRKAVDDHYWMFVEHTERNGSPEIGHEGE